MALEKTASRTVIPPNDVASVLSHAEGRQELSQKVLASFRNNARAQQVVVKTQQRLLGASVTPADLEKSTLILRPEHLVEVVTERSLEGFCGYPLCKNLLTKRRRAALKARVGDDTPALRSDTHYCSKLCLDKCVQFSLTLSSEPFFFRTMQETKGDGAELTRNDKPSANVRGDSKRAPAPQMHSHAEDAPRSALDYASTLTIVEKPTQFVKSDNATMVAAGAGAVEDAPRKARVSFADNVETRVISDTPVHAAKENDPAVPPTSAVQQSTTAPEKAVESTVQKPQIPKRPLKKNRGGSAQAKANAAGPPSAALSEAPHIIKPSGRPEVKPVGPVKKAPDTKETKNLLTETAKKNKETIESDDEGGDVDWMDDDEVDDEEALDRWCPQPGGGFAQELFRQLSPHALVVNSLVSWTTDDTRKLLSSANFDFESTVYVDDAYQLQRRQLLCRIIVEHVTDLCRKFRIAFPLANFVGKVVDTFAVLDQIPNFTENQWVFVALVFLELLSTRIPDFQEQYDKVRTTVGSSGTATLIPQLLKTIGFDEYQLQAAVDALQ